MSLDHLWLSFECSLFWFFDWGRRTTIWRAPLRQAGCRMAAPAESPWCWAAVGPHGWPASFDVSSGCVEWWWGCLDSSIWPNVVAHATILVHSWGNLNFVWRFICVLFAMFLSIPIVDDGCVFSGWFGMSNHRLLFMTNNVDFSYFSYFLHSKSGHLWTGWIEFFLTL